MRAIRSILAQTYAAIEIVVMDNASDDDTPDCVASLHDQRLVYVRHERNIGMVANFSACLERASGEYFLLLSDDDYLEPPAITRLIEPFLRPMREASPDRVGITWCPAQIIDETGKPLWKTHPGPAVEDGLSLLLGLWEGTRGPQLCSLLYRTHDVRAAGGYDTRYGDICDVGNYAKILIRYPFTVCIPEALANYTAQTQSETAKSSVEAWATWNERIIDDLLAELARRGDQARMRRLAVARKNVMSTLVAHMLIRKAGSRGFMRYAIAEIVRYRRYMFTLYVVKRLARDGWKLLRLKRPRPQQQ